MSWGLIVGGLAALWAWATLCVAVASIYKRWRLGRAKQPAPAVAGRTFRALMVRPCAGMETDLDRCLMSYARAQLPDRIDLVLAVDDEKDSAWPTVQRACQELHEQGVAVDAVVVSRRGANRKAAILAQVVSERTDSYDVIINADSNVDLSGFNVAELVEAFAGGSHLGALWVPAIEASDHRSLGNRASEAVLSNSFHAFPLLCGVDQKGLVGKLFAVRTSALEKTGGFEALVDFLGEDFELARRLLVAGYETKPVTAIVRSRSGPKAFWETVSRQARWMTVVRAQRPGHLISYPLWFFPLLPIAALALSALFGSTPALGCFAIVIALLARLLVAISARRFSGLSWDFLTALRGILLADIVLALAWVKALVSRRVFWRGQVLRLDASGRVTAVGDYR